MNRFLVLLVCLVLILPGLILSSSALIMAIDHTDVISVADYSNYLKQGITRAIIRASNSACDIGGEVNPSFVPSYNNARQAGFTDIQGYVLLCNGNNITACKSYQAQINEIEAAISSNKMIIGTLWFDIERDDDCPGNVRMSSFTNRENRFITLLVFFFVCSGIMARLAIRLRLRSCLLQSRILLLVSVSTASRTSVVQIKIVIER